MTTLVKLMSLSGFFLVYFFIVKKLRTADETLKRHVHILSLFSYNDDGIRRRTGKEEKRKRRKNARNLLSHLVNCLISRQTQEGKDGKMK